MIGYPLLSLLTFLSPLHVQMPITSYKWAKTQSVCIHFLNWIVRNILGIKLSGFANLPLMKYKFFVSLDEINVIFTLQKFECPLYNLCILESPKWLLWPTVKTQMKCHRMWHFIRVCTVCKDKKYIQRNKFNIIWKLYRVRTGLKST